MKNNRSDFLSGCICLYSVSILAYYTAYIFFIGKRMDAFYISHFIYVFCGALLLYTFDYLTRGRTSLFCYVLLSFFFAAGCFICFSLTKEASIELVAVCVCLSYCGKMLNDKPLEKISVITRFELTTILLLLLMVTLELKPNLNGNIIPMAAAVLISLAEVSRISVYKKNGDPLRIGVIGLYMAVLGCTVILVKEKSWILAGMSFAVEGIKQTGKALGSLVTGFFSYVAAHLTGKTSSLVSEHTNGEYMEESGHPGLLIGVIVLVFLLCAVLLIGFIKHRGKGGSTKKGKETRRRPGYSKPVNKVQKKQSFRKMGVWRFWLIPAGNPRIFLHKAAFLCRKSKLRLQEYHSPRQFMDHLLGAGLFDEAVKEQLAALADQIDCFYYSGSPQKCGYERRQGQLLLKEIRKGIRKEKRRNKRKH